MSDCILEAINSSNASVYKCADGKEVSVYLARLASGGVKPE